MSITLHYYVEYLDTYGRTYFSEIPVRDVTKIELRDKYIGFRFYDVIIMKKNGKSYIFKDNFSGWSYKGKKMTLEQFEANFGNNPKYKLMIRVMKCGKSRAVVQTSSGAIITLRDKDNVL